MQLPTTTTAIAHGGSPPEAFTAMDSGGGDGGAGGEGGDGGARGGGGGDSGGDGGDGGLSGYRLEFVRSLPIASSNIDTTFFFFRRRRLGIFFAVYSHVATYCGAATSPRVSGVWRCALWTNRTAPLPSITSRRTPHWRALKVQTTHLSPMIEQVPQPRRAQKLKPS